MINGQLMDMLIDHAKQYCPGALESINRNSHMNEYHGEKVSQNVIDALIVDFINFIGSQHCLDLGLYTKHLYEEEVYDNNVSMSST